MNREEAKAIAEQFLHTAFINKNGYDLRTAIETLLQEQKPEWIPYSNNPLTSADIGKWAWVWAERTHCDGVRELTIEPHLVSELPFGGFGFYEEGSMYRPTHYMLIGTPPKPPNP